MSVSDNPKLKQFLINTLRRASYRWPFREEARRRNKVDRNQYTCEQCKGVFTRKETQINHKEPVVDPKIGWVNLDVYAERLFVGADLFELLCVPCHDKLTEEQNKERKEVKADKKAKDKKK